MVHSGFEASAVADIVKHPLRALGVMLNGVRTEGPMAPDIPVDKQRPAEFVFSKHVDEALADIKATQPRAKKVARAAG